MVVGLIGTLGVGERAVEADAFVFVLVCYRCAFDLLELATYRGVELQVLTGGLG